MQYFNISDPKSTLDYSTKTRNLPNAVLVLVFENKCLEVQKSDFYLPKLHIQRSCATSRVANFLQSYSMF